MTFIIPALVILVGVSATFADESCTARGGWCQYTSDDCSGEYVSGLCDGPWNRRCCVPSGSQDQRCTARGGTCQYISNDCSGEYVSGLCEGPWNRRCCVPSGSQGGGSCTVRRYTNSNFVGESVHIDDGFRGSLDIVNEHAIACGVKVYVTHSWRKLGDTVGGAIVTPASTSNHLVGHAIDFNLIGSSFCNSICMQENYQKSGDNPYKCFLNKVMSSGLRWGGVWSSKDPVHIDDHYNGNLDSYQNLRTILQAACEHVPI